MSDAPVRGATSFFIGLVAGERRGHAIDRVIGAIANQSLEPDIDLMIGIASSAEAREGAALADITTRSRSGADVRIVHLAGRPGDRAGANHGALNDLALSHGFERYIGLDARGIPHHGAVQALAERWATLDDGLLEMRLFPEEHPKIYDFATGETAWCSATCFGVATRRLKALGGFDDRFTAYFHDVDLSWRIRASGGTCHLVPRALFLCDRGREAPSHFVRIQMLRDARRLAWKWRHAAFQHMIEDRLIALGVAGARGDLETLSGEQVAYDADTLSRICDFDHDLDFAFLRW